MKLPLPLPTQLVYRALCIVVCTLMVYAPSVSYAQANEYEIKAAFLFNFALFTQTIATAPTPARSPDAAKTDDDDTAYRVCIHGKSPFGTALKSLTKRKVARRPILVVPDAALDALNTCSMVFIAEDDRETARRAVTALRGLPIITVAEAKEFPLKDVIFNLIVIDDKVAFQVNTVAAKGQKLDVSSKLIRLAKNVH